MEKIVTMIRHGCLRIRKRGRICIVAAVGVLLASALCGCASSWRYTSSVQPNSQLPDKLQLKLKIVDLVDTSLTAADLADHPVLRRMQSAETSAMMATAERMYPSLFAKDDSALPVSLKVGTKSWPNPYTWTHYACALTLGVLPGITSDETKHSVYLELLDANDGVLISNRVAFERRDVGWHVALTPLILLSIPGRSDRPKVHSFSGTADAVMASAEFTRECYVEAIIQTIVKADQAKLERAYAARRKRFGGGSTVITTTPTTPLPPDLPGYDTKRLHALVIGIDKYKHWPALKCAVNDAKAVAAVLKQDYGFANVTLLTDGQATREGILNALDGYSKLTEKDCLLVYYAGHGWMDGKTKSGYWVPADARQGKKFDYIANSQIAEDDFKKYKVKHLLVIADSCFSGTLLRGQKVVRDDDFSLPAGFRKPSRWVLTSGGLKPVPDGQVDHSPFAARLLQYLKFTEQRSFGVLDLQVYLRKNLDTDPVAGPLQTPRHMPGGEFIFRRVKAVSPKK